MPDDTFIDRFLKLLDDRNRILGYLKKNECEHFIVKKQRNASEISQIS